MKSFKFKLEKVLEIRKFEEEQAKIELGKAVSLSNKIKQNLEFIASERVKNNNERGKSVDINFLMQIEDYINALDIKKEQLLIDLTNAELVVEEKRKLYTEAMQKRKVLDKLKERQLLLYKADCETEEQNELDDINSKLRKNDS